MWMLLSLSLVYKASLWFYSFTPTKTRIMDVKRDGIEDYYYHCQMRFRDVHSGIGNFTKKILNAYLLTYFHI